jgi:NAD(P)-dependent dehydrogenase (short-subunit alcohol dehydrogenase family)
MSSTVLITGAGRGLGRAAALALLSAGYSVIGTTNTHPEDADEFRAAADPELAEKIEFTYFDAADFDSYPTFVATIQSMLQKRGSSFLHAVVNNAGIGTFASFIDTTEQQFDDLFNINVKAPYFLTQQLVPLLGQGSRVLNVTSALTRGVVKGMSAYAMTKSAVEAMTRYQGAELAERGIAVNTLMGGAVDTDFGGGLMRIPAVQAMAADAIAWSRIAEPSNIANAVPLILSDGFSWATGSVVDLSGGQSI